MRQTQRDTETSNYSYNTNFTFSQLFTGHGGFWYLVYMEKIENNICNLCNTNEIQDFKHILYKCSKFHELITNHHFDRGKPITQFFQQLINTKQNCKNFAKIAKIIIPIRITSNQQ